MIKKFLLTAPRFEHPAGTLAYEFQGCDYGLCSYDEKVFGTPHMVLTTDPHGIANPFFTIPVADTMALN